MKRVVEATQALLLCIAASGPLVLHWDLPLEFLSIMLETSAKVKYIGNDLSNDLLSRFIGLRNQSFKSVAKDSFVT